MTALFVNQLTTLDFSFLSPERGVVGETWLADVVLYGDLDEQGMVFDFGHVKKQVKASLDFLADHRLLVPVAHSSIQVNSDKNRLDITMESPGAGTINCKAPAQAILLIDAEQISTDVLTPVLEKALLSELPDNVKDVKLRLYNEPIEGAYYHYSHGLKKHLGDCQRIAHGHRSAIQVHVNGVREQSLEKQWAKRWQDIYIAIREDLIERFEQNGRAYNRFGYTSDQGYFELTIAEHLCYLIDTDSTVELLAQHIAAEIGKELAENSNLQVTAYEGFQKGSIAVVRT
ncbi:6-carboxytetrahydropterin synthase [Endozoicomonas euniceicola]|uniref:6-carboxy-5,6,7,8-tetrahydropterin synthase n=1 Tax=Endozoicomonas euniceicola TaxID=1234143 RepID=A0ABY6GX92_9GAMM|nr:6-carboxytetrahydropterin synthase [Endozoicomonas euniceicola]UYM17403.1 6-carboxytetrahydropterin synthase [Endozoicomonas euniceicola]